MNISVQKANVEDLKDIHKMVYELAVFEKEPEAMISTLEEYEEAFDKGLFDSLVAKENGKTVGMALYYMTFSTWKGPMLYLEDFFVLPEYRSHGVGQMLFDSFLNTAKNLGVRLVKWQVLDWNEQAVKFYERNNAVIEKQWWNGKIFLE
jgi:GNAT superfamily N-acetyltransferase